MQRLDIKNRKLDLLALFAGSLMPLAFSPFDIYLTPLLCIGMLLFVWRNASPSQAALRGYLFGWGYFGFGVYWVYFSIHHFGHAPLWLSVIIMLGMVAILATYFALLGYLLNRFFMRKPAVRYVLAFPILWLALEWLRGVLFTGFPWLFVGYSQIDSYLAGWAPIAGVLGVSWLLVLTASCVYLLIQSQCNWARPVALGVVALCWLGGWGVAKINWTEPVGKPISVALLQGNVPQEIKWLRSFQQISLTIYRQMTEQVLGADLIVWPETAIPSFYHRVESTFLQNLKHTSVANKTDVVLGLPVMGESAGEYYNSLLSVRHLGRFYQKRHLVPLGEYMPLKPLSTFILAFLNIPLSDFSAGQQQQPLLTAAGYPFASSICYEDVFQQTSLDGLPEAAYLINVSNDTWFGDTIAPYQHLQMARMRALESGRYLLRATNTGLTAIVNEKGRLVKQAAMFERLSLRGELVPMQGVTPFVRGGASGILILMLVLLVLAFLKRDK